MILVMGFPDWLDLAVKIVAVVVPVAVGTTWLIRWWLRREEDQLIEDLDNQHAAGRGNGFAPILGTRQYRIARRCVAKGKLERVGDGYFLPGATRHPESDEPWR